MDCSRTGKLLCQEDIRRLREARIALIGLGGVGSYVAEALARSGIGFLRLIDGDSIAPSDCNRQLPALTSTIGRMKAEVVGERLMDISLCIAVERVEKFYRVGDFSTFFPGRYDFIVDAIDDVPAKVDIITNCVKARIPVVSAMGTGKKLDPSLLQIADISATSVCPLARAVRSGLRKNGVLSGVPVVYSQERPIENSCAETDSENSSSTIGSMVFVPASAGLLMASYVVRELTK